MAEDFKDSSGRDIREIQVYNPKDHGLTYETWTQAHNTLRAIKPKLEYLLSAGVYGMADLKPVHEDIRLREFVAGYFEAHPDLAVVVFLDGKFHSQYSDYFAYDGEKLAKEASAVPLMFQSPIDMSDSDIQIRDVCMRK